jgi:hypothetical protein
MNLDDELRVSKTYFTTATTRAGAADAPTICIGITMTRWPDAVRHAVAQDADCLRKFADVATWRIANSLADRT